MAFGQLLGSRHLGHVTFASVGSTENSAFAFDSYRFQVAINALRFGGTVAEHVSHFAEYWFRWTHA